MRAVQKGDRVLIKAPWPDFGVKECHVIETSEGFIKVRWPPTLFMGIVEWVARDRAMDIVDRTVYLGD